MPDVDQVYFQSARTDDGYLVEFRDGSPDKHFGATVPDVRAAHALATQWAFELDGWRTAVPWERQTF
ncbi:hypothetical protein C8046_07685 [Serinibacter arcticus]|uniref:Uncharacterized protein n=1 Tax=Serinibacter arcticus TaxID=1655435 RepID=A0A2U1ZUD0_9MICO|nr:hypothetical protein C8046_07685 [Serinibacter arcticus]